MLLALGTLALAGVPATDREVFGCNNDSCDLRRGGFTVHGLRSHQWLVSASYDRSRRRAAVGYGIARPHRQCDERLAGEPITDRAHQWHDLSGRRSRSSSSCLQRTRPSEFPVTSDAALGHVPNWLGWIGRHLTKLGRQPQSISAGPTIFRRAASSITRQSISSGLRHRSRTPARLS